MARIRTAYGYRPSLKHVRAARERPSNLVSTSHWHQRLLMLTGIILLRTFLSATLMLEVEGRWPWSAARRDVRPLPFSTHS